MLLARLPEEAWCQRDEGSGVEHWDVTRELLAQIADSVMVLASDHRYKEPVRIPRPEKLAGRVKGGDGAAVPYEKPSAPEEVAAFFGTRVVR